MDCLVCDWSGRQLVEPAESGLLPLREKAFDGGEGGQVTDVFNGGCSEQVSNHFKLG